MDQRNYRLTPSANADGVHEAQPKYMEEPHKQAQDDTREKASGGCTLEDYYAIPDERRVELIDGVIYDMASPNSIHQLVSSFIFNMIFRHISENRGKCIPAIAPLDVQLDCDERTMVQPDIMIICDRKKIIRRCVYGAPDFIAEILSPSTGRRDVTLKLHKYMRAGVREYWMIDPESQQVLVCESDSKDLLPAAYNFDAKLPIKVLDGKCVIDFAQVRDYVQFLYDQADEAQEKTP